MTREEILDIHFYSVDNQIIFPMRGQDGGLLPENILYLVNFHHPEFPKNAYKYGIKFRYLQEDSKQLCEIVLGGVKEFIRKLENENSGVVDLDGGTFGAGDNQATT